MWPALDDPAFRLGEDTVTYGELLLVGAETGLFESANAETTRARRALSSRLVEPGRDELRAEALAFRRRRKLGSGEDLRAWLADRELTTVEWEGHLLRSVAARSAVEPPEKAIEDHGFQEALAVDLACGGWWRKVADENRRYWAAGCVAVGPSGSPDPSTRSDPDLRANDIGRARNVAERWTTRLAPFGPLDAEWCATRLRVLWWRQSCLEQARQHFSSDPSVAGRIADHSADWIQFVFDSLCLPTRAAAHEAVMCARDGISPEEIARRSLRPLDRLQLRQAELAAGTAALLSGAVPGEALGPLESAGGLLVLWLHERRPPSPTDPETRQAAASELLFEALDLAAGGRARAVGPL